MQLPVTRDLEDGPLLLIKGDLEQFWEHRKPKPTKPIQPRVTLTFRVIM